MWNPTHLILRLPITIALIVIHISASIRPKVRFTRPQILQLSYAEYSKIFPTCRKTTWNWFTILFPLWCRFHQVVSSLFSTNYIISQKTMESRKIDIIIQLFQGDVYLLGKRRRVGIEFTKFWLKTRCFWSSSGVVLAIYFLI